MEHSRYLNERKTINLQSGCKEFRDAYHQDPGLCAFPRQPFWRQSFGLPFDPLSSAEAQRVFFFRVDPLSNVSAGTELQATAESAGASARYHTQDGRHPGETIFSELLSGVA